MARSREVYKLSAWAPHDNDKTSQWRSSTLRWARSTPSCNAICSIKHIPHKMLSARQVQVQSRWINYRIFKDNQKQVLVRLQSAAELCPFINRNNRQWLRSLSLRLFISIQQIKLLFLYKRSRASSSSTSRLLKPSSVQFLSSETPKLRDNTCCCSFFILTFDDCLKLHSLFHCFGFPKNPSELWVCDDQRHLLYPLEFSFSLFDDP